MNELVTNNTNIKKMTENINQLNIALNKIAKFTNLSFNFDFSSIDGMIKSAENMDKKLTGIVKSFSGLGDFNKNLDDLAGKGSVLASAYNTVNNALLGNIANLNLQTIATTMATGATYAFRTVMEFLGNNPLMAVIGGQTVLAGVLSTYEHKESEAEKQTRLFTEAQEAKRNELIETSKAINESIADSLESSKNAEIESEVLRGYVDSLKELSSENGYVKSFEEAQYYVDQINSSMPGTVELTEEGRLKWLENADAIEENIKQLERKAKVEAYYDGYVESLKNESKLRAELALAQNNYNKELDNKNALQKEFDELIAASHERKLTLEESQTLEKDFQLIQESEDKLKSYSETLLNAKGAYEANAKGAELYQNAVSALDGSIEASAKLQANEYLILEEDGTSTWQSIAAATVDCKNRMEEAQGEELEIVKATNNLVQAEMINKANAFGLNYDQMIEKLKESGVQMSASEEEQLKESYDRWALNSDQIAEIQASGLDTLKFMKVASLSDMSKDEEEILAKSVRLFADTGSREGLELCNQLAENLEANGGKVDDSTRDIVKRISKEIDNCTPDIKIGAEGPSEKIMNNIRSTLDTIPGTKNTILKVTAKADKKSFSLFGIELPWFASGGFPDTGELFIAREAGPELVGRINGKTAVANNDQIVSGISSGVYNAITSAMQGIGGKGNMNIHATFVMDGEVIGKQVIKYHNGVVKRTGNSPLMV